MYVVFYGARKYEWTRWNKRTKKDDTVLIDPERGQFADFAAGFRKRAAFQRIDMNNFVLIDGGFRERLSIEIWLVPAGSNPPPISPTVDPKSVRYRRGVSSSFRGICDEI